MDYSHLGKKRNIRKQNPHTTRVRNKVSLLVLRITLGLVLIAGFALLGGGVGMYFGILSNAPELNTDMVISEYRTSFIVCSHTGEEFPLHAGHNHAFVSIEQIPMHVQHAFIAIEDERFFEHNGIDIRGIGRAAHRLVESGGARTEGASTITQQLIKNMLDRFESNFVYKLQEQYLAVNWERELTEYYGCRMEAKDFILESYLNIINLGRSNYGVQAAARFYYDIDVWDLSIVQAATIASITQNPSRFPPDTRSAANWVRTQLVLENMLRLEFITQEEFDEAIKEVELEDGTMIGAVYSTIVRTEAGTTRPIISQYDCFTNALLDSVRDDLMRKNNWDRNMANRQIFGGGLRIYTTQNPQMQAVVDRVFLDESYWPMSDFSIDVEFNFSLYNTVTNQTRNFQRMRNVLSMDKAEAWMQEVLDAEMTAQDIVVENHPLFTPQPQSAFVLLDHHTGHVLALRGVRGESGANRTFNRATQSHRQPGSQLKTIGVFGPAFDMGIMHPGTIIVDEPWTYIDPWTGTPWTPRNFWGSSRWYGPTTARRAIYVSKNVVSARATVDHTIPHVGVDAMFAYLRNMGISTIVDGHDGPAVSLGGMHLGVHLIELAGAYGMVANQGMFNAPALYTKVLGYRGEILLENPVNPTRVFRETAAYLLIDTMKDTMTAPGATGHRANWHNNAQLRQNIPIAGKTGTTNDRRDLGFSGSTPYFTASIWMGNDNNERMTSGVAGYHLIAWRTIMQEIHENLPPRQFIRPGEGRLVTATLCRDSGLLACELCRLDSRGNRAHSAIMDAHHVPTQRCDWHVEFTYCVTHGYLVGPYCHADAISTRVGISRHDVFGGFPEPVLDGIICPHCEPPEFNFPWEDPEWQPPTDGPPMTLLPGQTIPPPPPPPQEPEEDFSDLPTQMRPHPEPDYDTTTDSDPPPGTGIGSDPDSIVDDDPSNGF